MRPGWAPAAALLLVAGCGRPAPAPEWHQEAGYRWRELRFSPRGAPGFTQLARRATGIAFENRVSDSALLVNQLLADGAGVAMADVDGDGLVDVYLCRTEGPNALYRNLGNWRFQEIGAEAGVAVTGRASTGAVLADFDGDGDADLILNALGGPNALFRNDGKGRFTEDSTYPGRTSRAGSTTSTVADVDGDGDLDLYTANYKAYTATDRYSPQERAFDQVVRRTGEKTFEVAERFREDYRVSLRDDLQAVVLVQRADPDWLYLNDGSGRFEALSIARSPRFLDQAGRPFDVSPDNFTLAARFYDINGDRAPDLYVANDFEDPDQLWLNDGLGVFRLAPAHALRTTSNSAMAVDFGDVNRDGKVDFFEVDMLSRDSRQLRTQIPTHTALPKQPGVSDDRPQLQRNTLFLNRGDGTFAQIAELAGVDATGWTWSTLLADVDLDGYEDILTGTGNRWDFMDADIQDRFRNRLSALDWRQQRMEYPLLAVPNYAFRNRGDLTFEDVSDRWHFSAGPDVSHGMSTGDLDQDGDLDVVINRLGAPALVLRNDATAPRIAVALKGRAPNTAGIGAKVQLRGGPVALQEREMTAGGLYLSSAEPTLSFAAGTADSLELTVIWRGGMRSVIRNARPNRLYQIDEREAAPAPPRAEAESRLPLFSDQSASLGHRHTETLFDDTRRQALLPSSLAQLGPGVSWIDFDGDGDDDLAVAAGKTGKAAVLRNEGGYFAPADLGLAPAEGDLTTILEVPGAGRGKLLLFGQSSYEAGSYDSALALPSVLAVPLDPAGRRAGPVAVAVPGDTASIGPLALSDYDQDGDLDLFVGGRVLPGRYPLSPSSRLFRNQGEGRFVLDTANASVLRHIGMVSSAVFSDLDQDGDADLLLAIDWGPLKAYWNNGGRFSAAPASLGFDRRYSRWLGLATGDFDGDGRPDIVATSWGRNVRPHADSLTPLFLYFGDFDGNNTLDILLGQQDTRLGEVAPIASFARLSRALPGVSERVRSFREYAEAGVSRTLGPAANDALRFGATTFDHLVWLNRGTHFEPRPLPMEAQFAPSVAPVVGDFDGDGKEDLALSQNFFPTDLGSPRYDAGRALLLRGDGAGGFVAVPGQESGLLVYGDQRGAATADYDRDARPDLVITQNGGDTRLFRNQRGAPGVRIRLEGGSGNPGSVGAQLRLRFGAEFGPRREVQAGSGYWSAGSTTQVLGFSATPTALQVRWPDGKSVEVPLLPQVRGTTLTIRP